MKRNRVYSFDLFETVVNRLVDPPINIFKLMVHEAKQKDITLPEDFYQRRVLAEKRASDKKKNYNIFDIYDCIEDVSIPKEILVKLEFETELKYAVINKKTYDLIKRLYSRGEDIYILSDMYWPSSYLVEYLAYFGVTEFKSVFVSCDCNAFKYDGSLFRYILKTLKLSPYNLVHTGDNKRSDYCVPKLMGITANLVNKNTDYNELYLSHKTVLESSKYDHSRFVFCMLDRDSNREYQLGYSLFGPLLYEFIKWIEAKRIDSGRRLFFLSRDGLIIKKAYEILYPCRKTCYFYASRKALLVPTIHYYDTYEEIKNCMFCTGKETYGEILDKLGIDLERYADAIDLSVSLSDQVDERFEDVYEALKEVIDVNSIEQEKLLQRYIEEQELCNDSMIIDIGWFGNMQYSLEKILNNNAGKIKGLYVGVVPYSKRVISKQVDAEGFLFGPGEEKYYQMIKSISAFFEFFFTAEHGSVIGYVDGDRIQPKFGEAEFEKNGDGKEKAQHGQFQDGALQFIKDRTLYPALDDYGISKKIALTDLELFIDSPRNNDIERVKDIVVSEQNGNIRRMVNARTVMYYVLHPESFMTDFKEAGIKTAFFKSIFKINIPYLRTYLLVRNICGKRNT